MKRVCWVSGSLLFFFALLFPASRAARQISDPKPSTIMGSVCMYVCMYGEEGGGVRDRASRKSSQRHGKEIDSVDAVGSLGYWTGKMAWCGAVAGMNGMDPSRAYF